jgi:hypothetical protein
MKTELREGWTLATEVAQTARPHYRKGANKRYVYFAPFL